MSCEFRNVGIGLFCVLCVSMILSGCGGGPEEVSPEKMPAKKLTGTSVIIKDLASADVVPQSGIILASLTVATDQPDITWEGLSVKRIGTVRDEDITRLAIYKDDGDKKFDTTNDNIVGVGKFYKGRAEIKLTPQSLKKQPELYFLTVDIDKKATAEASFAIRIADETCFRVTDPLGVMSFDWPFTSTVATINPTLDNLIVTPKNMAPFYVKPGAKDVPIMGLILCAEKEKVVWNGITLSRIGTCQDSDISQLILYADDGDRKFEPLEDTKIGKGIFVESMVHIDISDQIITADACVYFITVDINTTVTPKSTFGIKCAEANCFQVLAPNGVRPGVFPFVSGLKGEGTSLGMDVKAILEERAREKTIKQQENEFLAQKYYETALKLFKEFNYKQALDNIQKALEYNPYHQEAEKLKTELSRLLGGARAQDLETVKEYMERHLSVRVQEVEMEVRNHFLKAEKLITEGKLREAIYEYEAVEEKVKWNPYGINILARYREKAQARCKETREKLAQQEKEQTIRQRLAAAQVAQLEEEKRLQEFNQKIRSLFAQAILNFEQRRYKNAERLADKILRLVPSFKAVQSLKETCIQARHKKAHEQYIKLKIQRWRLIQEDFEEGFVPYAEDQLVRYDRETWDTALRREPPGLVEEEIIEDPDILEIKRKLETIKHNFVLDESSTLLDQTDSLQENYGIPINYELEARELALERRSLTLKGLPLKIGLKHLLKQYGLTYVFKEKSLFIVQEGTAAVEKLQIRIHNVDDLVRPIEDFAGPSIELPQQEVGGFVPPLPPELEPRGVIEIDELIELIKQNAGRDTWEDSDNPIPGAVIEQLGDSNRLMIVHTPQVHKEVSEFLQALRSFSGSMVSMEALFIAVTKDFLEDVGVELRDISGGPNAVDVMPSGITQVGNAGFTRATSKYDVRFRSAYSFVNPTSGMSEVSIGQRLSSRGGLGLQYTVFKNNDPKLNIIARALKKRGRGVVLDAPRVMALNGQRVFVLFLRQQSYIRDLDVTAGAVAYDPVLDVFQTGAMLDIKPVMSFDRKYITLHTAPTLVRLKGLRRFSIQDGPLAEDDDDTGSIIQLPWIEYQRAMTTIIVPDKGSLILGGLKRSADLDIEATTPLLAKLPLVGSLFRRRAKSSEKENLLIILKAEVVELAEIERELE